MRLVYWSLGLLALFMLVAGTAAATHYRYGTLSWEPTENPNEVRFLGGQAWRASYFGGPEPGSILQAEGCLSTGDGACVTFYLKVNARSYVNDYFSATFVDAAGNEGFVHTYPSADNGGAPWNVRWSSCCRISSLSSGNYHVNNPDQSEALFTSVDLDSGNAAPRSTLPPINACPREALCTLVVPAADPDGDTMAFRLSTPSEAGDSGYVPPGPGDAPHGAAIDGASGVLTWDTHGATVGASNVHTLYSIQVMIEDNETQTPLDFFIEILPEGVTPPYWVMPPTPCGQTLSANVGSPLDFDVVARSDGAQRVVRVSDLGLPAGAVFPPVTPANPASGVFSWTPTLSQLGEHLVVFAAEDDLGYPAPACPVNIVVTDHPLPECVAPTLLEGISGVPISFDVSASSVNASRTVTLSLASGPTGLTFSAAAPGNPTSGSVSWPSPYVGAPPARFVATDSGGVRGRCVVTFDILDPAGQAFTLGAWAGTAVPVAAEYASGGFDVRAVGQGSAPFRRTTAFVDHPQLGLHAEGIVEWAQVSIQDGVVTSNAGSEIASLSLAGGAVQLYGVRQDATLTWDGTTGASSVSRAASIVRAVVNGQDVPVAPGAPLAIPIPGGVVALFETSDTSDPLRVALEDRLVHVYTSAPLGRHEAILGSIILQAGGGLDFGGQPRSIHAHDDLRSGEDAGSDADTAMPLPLGAFDANMPAGDAADAYVLTAAHGEKIVFVAEPAAGVYAAGGDARATDVPPPVVAPPGVAFAPLETFRARLYDPLGALREESLPLASGTPARVELNADIPGDWVVVVTRDASAVATNYTLALTVTPVALLPQNDALSSADAAPACVAGGAPDIPLVQSGLWPGVVRDDDFADVYRFHAEIGEIVGATLKPGEDADGAAMGLRLYDRDCALLASMDGALGLLKGEPSVTLALPSLYSGDYFVQVVRLNGVGNHYVEIAVANPMPTLPMNDALTGADAPADASQAIAAPAVAFQGRLHEGDEGDAYKLAFTAGQGDAFIAFSMSALSDVDVQLYDPAGNLVAPMTALSSAAVVWNFSPALTGDHVLVVTPVYGGGSYSVVWGQLPAETPEP